MSRRRELLIAALATLGLGGYLLGLDWAGGTFESTPASGDPVSEGDDRIRELKNQIRRRLEVEMQFGNDNGTDTGLARLGSARVFRQDATPANMPSVGAFKPSTEGNTALGLSNLTDGVPFERQGDGRLWVDSDGGAPVTTVTGDINRLQVYDGTDIRWEEVTARPAFFYGTNLLRNGDFEDQVDAATATPVGWSLSGTPSAITHQDVDTSEGAGHEVAFSAVGAADEGILQVLAGLKVGGLYYAVVRADEEGGGTGSCSMRTTGLAANQSATTSSTSYQTLQFTFTADVDTMTLILEDDTDDVPTCTFDHAGVFEKPINRIPEAMNFVRYGTSTAVTAVPDAFTGTGLVSLTVTVPGPGYAVKVTGDVCAIEAGVADVTGVQVQITENNVQVIRRGASVDEVAASAGNVDLTVPVFYVNTNPTPGASLNYEIEAQDAGFSMTHGGASAVCSSVAASLMVELVKQH